MRTVGTTVPDTTPAAGGAPSVIVVGGGVIGLCCAHALRRGGAQVTVIERDACGGAASLGNGGWVTPGLSAPIPAPGLLRQVARWMLDPGSPLFVRPRADLGLLRWAARFARSCTARAHRAGTAATLALAHDAPERFDALRDDGVRFEMHADGLLYLVRDRAALDPWLAMYDELAALGFDGALTLLEGDELRRREPAIADGVAAGLLGGRERHVRPESLTRALRGRLDDLGVAIHERIAVAGLRPAGAGWRVETADGATSADRVVVAAGAWTADLLAGLGVRVPLEAAKGYSVTAASGAHAPRRPLYLTELKVGASPFDGAVRLAGTLELTGLDLRLNRRRIDAVARGAERYLHTWRADVSRVEWAGLRPLAPDGLPIIGEVPGHRGLYVATGHGMLGVTLAPATGAALAPLVLDDRLVPALAPLGLDRFGGRPAGRRARAAR